MKFSSSDYIFIAQKKSQLENIYNRMPKRNFQMNSTFEFRVDMASNEIKPKFDGPSTLDLSRAANSSIVKVYPSASPRIRRYILMQA